MTASTIGEWLAIVVAGMAAGAINTLVGSGTLITFPVLLAFGIPPVSANVSNALGLVAGGLSGSWGYRRELSGQGAALRRLVPMSVVGSVAGAVLLLVLPSAAFAAIVPVLIGIGILLVLVQPFLARRVAERAARRQAGDEPVGPAHGLGTAALLGVLLAGVYGGYFGAAQGVILLGLLGSVMVQDLQRTNAVKNVLGTVVNGVAAITFLVIALDRIDWVVAALIAVGSLLGGTLGARVGRRMPAPLLRAVIVVVGVVAIVRLL